MFAHVTGGTPRSIHLLACGQTAETYKRLLQVYDPIIPPADEIWTVNKSLRYERADLVFILDDLVGECRKSERYAREIAELSRSTPIITSIVDHDVVETLCAPAADAYLFPYPYSEICHYLGYRHLLASGKVEMSLAEVYAAGRTIGSYMHNSIPMILLYAAFIGVRRVNLFGADYTDPKGANIREADRANCEYAVGLIRGLGVDVWVTQDSSLLNTCRQPWVYGYGARQPIYRQPDEADAADLKRRFEAFIRDDD
jgi:hypothetical protein